jgi:4a-hydroxytetrahydrobiopterin dehydratase
MSLAQKKCAPCSGEIPPLIPEEIQRLMGEIPNWHLEDGKLTRLYTFKNFKKPMELANRIADIAEEQNHHPDLLVRWGELRVSIFTHAINGLTESDFIVAAKIDLLT